MYSPLSDHHPPPKKRKRKERKLPQNQKTTTHNWVARSATRALCRCGSRRHEEMDGGFEDEVSGRSDGNDSSGG